MLSMKWEPKSIFKLLCDKYVDIRNCFYCWDCCFSFQFQSIGFPSLTLLTLLSLARLTTSSSSHSPPPPLLLSLHSIAFYRFFHFEIFLPLCHFLFYFIPFSQTHTYTQRNTNRIFLFVTMVKSIFFLFS